MNKNNYSAIIISASSDIGAAICRRWKSKGWHVYGTYRTQSKAVEELKNLGMELVYCDLSSTRSVKNACSGLKKVCKKWDILVLCPGTQVPVSSFDRCNFDEWEESIKVNFTSQIRIVHELLPLRNVNVKLGPCVLFFAGGGTNNATVNYSAYTVSKIALIKMCELLDAEIADTRFSIVGPGWVKTKIHNATLKAGLKAGQNYNRTLEKLASNECVPMSEVLDCCDWIVNTPRKIISGRNFSLVFDKWGAKELKKKLLENSDMYKLRRFGNECLVKEKDK